MFLCRCLGLCMEQACRCICAANKFHLWAGNSNSTFYHILSAFPACQWHTSENPEQTGRFYLETYSFNWQQEQQSQFPECFTLSASQFRFCQCELHWIPNAEMPHWEMQSDKATSQLLIPYKSWMTPNHKQETTAKMNPKTLPEIHESFKQTIKHISTYHPPAASH